MVDAQGNLTPEEARQYKQNAMSQIYEKVNAVLSGGESTQLFAMLSPAQPLNQAKFKYDTSSYASVLTRPWLVEEEEFRLSDQLFDLSPIIMGPNGKKLSQVYRMLIDNYLPKLNELAHYFKDRAGLSGFLLEDSGEVDEDGKPLSRMELCKKLYKIYLEKKNEWEQLKLSKVQKLKAETKNKTVEERSEELDDYANWHSSIAMVKEAELDNLYNDVVIRGHLHEVLTLLGYLNAASVAEELEKCKQKMRHSQRVSLDESMDVYPVQFIPNNWAEALTPNLHPQDLTMAEDVLIDQLAAKRQELRRLKEQLKELELLNVSEAQVDQLQRKVDAAKEAFEAAESEVVAKYGQSAIDALKIYLNAETGGASGLFEQIGKTAEESEEATQAGAKTEAKVKIKPSTFKKLKLGSSNLDPDVLQKVADDLVNVYNSEKETIQDAKKLAELQSRLIQYKNQNMDLQKVRLHEQIDSLQADVDYLGAMVSGVYHQNKTYADAGQYRDVGLVKIETKQHGTPGTTTDAVNTIQTIEVPADIASLTYDCTFSLTFNSKKTGDITYNLNLSSTDLEKNLTDALTASGIGPVKDDIDVEWSANKWKIEFKGKYAGTDVAPLTAADFSSSNNTFKTSPPSNVQLTVKTTRHGSPETTTGAQSAIQEISIPDTAVNSGTFKLTFNDKQTAGINHNADAAALTKALTDSGILTTSDIDVTGAGTIASPWKIAFKGNYANQEVTEFEVDPNDIDFKDSSNNKIAAIIDNRPELHVLPQKRTITAVDGLFEDVTVHLESQSQAQQSSQSSNSSNTSWGVSLGFASAGGSSSHATATSKQEEHFFKHEMDLGFRVAKVSFDRGGWFNPQLFDLAANGDFYRLSELRAGAPITIEDIHPTKGDAAQPDPIATIEKKLKYSYTAQDGNTKTGQYMLPIYPVAMVIAKDITFKVKMNKSDSGQTNAMTKDSSSYGGGFLCFHYSHASASSHSSQSTYHGSQGSSYYIRIPGPQILGYIMEFVPHDTTVIKPSYKDADDKLTFIEALQDFDNYANKLFPHQLAALGKQQLLNPTPNGYGSSQMAYPQSYNLPSQSSQPIFDLITPTNGSTVQSLGSVSGVIHDTTKQIWVVIHMVGTNMYWVEQKANVQQNGEWSCNVSFGRHGGDSGQEFEVRAFANPKGEMNPNIPLNGWPEAEFATNPITVRREQNVAKELHWRSPYANGHLM